MPVRGGPSCCLLFSCLKSLRSLELTPPALCDTSLNVHIPLGVALSILWRSFFIQAAWNFKGMQNIGFTYAILPGIRHIMPDRIDEGVQRYLPFFNTQPYMAPTIIGVYLNLHEQGKEDMITKLSPALSGTLAALGDTFFWATLKPILALLLLLCVFVDQLLGLVLALAIYNAVHLWVMAWGFHQGYRLGADGALAMGRLLSIDVTRYISLAIPFLSGAALGLAAVWFSLDSEFSAVLSGVDRVLGAGVVLFCVSVVLIKLRVGIFWLVYGVFTLSMIWTMLR